MLANFLSPSKMGILPKDPPLDPVVVRLAYYGVLILKVYVVAASGGISVGILIPSSTAWITWGSRCGGCLCVNGCEPWSVAMWCKPSESTSLTRVTISLV